MLGMALDGQSLNSQMGSNRGLSNDSLIKQALSKEVAKEVAKAERINHEMVINESSNKFNPLNCCVDRLA